MNPSAKPAKQEKWIAIKNSLRLHTRGRSVIFILLKLFFLKNSWSCPQAYRGIGRRQKSRLDGATDLLTTIWVRYNCQFCLSFDFGSAQEVQKYL